MACRQARMRDGHSSRTPVARRLQQPTRTGGSGHRSSRPRACAEGGTPSLFGLAPGGVCRAAGVAASAVRSYRTVSPLPRHTQRSAAVCSLWHFPWARTRRMLSGTACPRSPDFPPRQPFGFAGAAVRPTDRRGMGRPACFVKRRGGSRHCGRATRWCGPGREWQSGSAASPASTDRRRRRRAPGGNGAGTP